MATGKRAFEGKSQISVMASILEKDPPSMSELQPMTPPALERLVRTCLAKDPEDRFQSAKDVKLQLEWVAEAGSQVGVRSGQSARRKGQSRWVWAFAVVCLAIAAGSSIAWHRAASFQPMSVRASILPPKKMAFDFSPTRGGPVLSPDGTRLVYPVTAPSGKSTLWVRRLDSLTGQPLEGTEGASYPFWSPDSRYVAFFVDGKLEKIDAAGGPPQVLCDAPNGRGGSWSRKGEIVFAPDIFSGLDKVPSSGGTPAAVTRLDNSKDQASQRWPCFLPDGEHFLFWAGSWIGNTRTAGARHNAIYVGSLDGNAPKFLFKCDSDARYAPPGYLLYLKQRTLMARAFNANHLAFDGAAFPLDTDLAYSLDYRLGLFSAARGGMLVYQVTTNSGMQAAWLNAATGAIQPVGRFGQIQGLRLSPDGRRLAETIYAAKTGNADIWITDLTRGVSTRLTFNPAADDVPTWSPDGRRIAFSSDRKNGHDMGIYVKEASGVGGAKVLVAPKKGVEDYVTDWSRDGRFLTFTRLLPFVKDKQAELCLLPLTGKKRTVTVLTKTPFGGGNGVFSPEGRWLAFSSKGTGQMEVYLTTYPVPEGRWQISQGGGANPRWSRDGKTLYYRARGGKVMAVSLTLGKDTVTAGVPRMVAQLPFSEFQQPYWIYDVGPEGKRVMVLRPGAGGTIPLTLVTHWTAGIKK
jgi:Tol biopolymer transport system component